MPGTTIVNRIFRCAGFGLFLLSIGFLAFSVHRQFDAIRATNWGWNDIAVIAAASGLFGVSLAPLAPSRAPLLSGSNDREKIRRLAIVYAETSVFKYLPGNVFHFLGRNIVGRRFGVSHIAMGLATVYEIALSLLSAIAPSSAALSSAALAFLDPTWHLGFLSQLTLLPALTAQCVIVLFALGRISLP